MCVSAESSFGLTCLLGPVGAYCLKVASERDRSALGIAFIPLGFGIQQFCEGLVWIGLRHDDLRFARGAALAYLFFALAFWLFWIPFSARRLESRRWIRLCLACAAFLGFLGGAVLFVPILLDPEQLQISVVHHSLTYNYRDPPGLKIAPQIVWHLFYLAIISLPLMLVRHKQLVGYSTALVVSAVISHAVFWYAFASVWCLFAAIIALYLGYLFYHWPKSLVGQSEPLPVFT